MGRKSISKRKPSKLKSMPVFKTDMRKPKSLIPKLLNKGEAISIRKDGKKVSSEDGKK